MVIMLSRAVFVGVLFVGAIATAVAKSYNGDVCVGAVDFLLLDTTNCTSADAAVLSSLTLYPRWIESDCYGTLQKITCMGVYLKYAANYSGYCVSECLQVMTTCQSTISLLARAGNTVYSSILNSTCTSLNKQPCTDGGEISDSSRLSPVCPYPLGEIPQPSEGYLVKVDGTACAAPCPTIIFTNYEWEVIRQTIFWCMFLSVLGTFVVAITHLDPKFTMLRYFAIGLCLPALLIVLFLVVDDFDEQLCYSDVEYRIRGPFCVASAAISIFSLKLQDALVIFLSFQLYASTVLRVSLAKIDYWKNRWMVVTVVWPTLVTAIFLGVEGLGYEWNGSSGPICVFLDASHSTYYWVLHFWASLTAAIICFVLGVRSMIYLNTTIAKTRPNLHRALSRASTTESFSGRSSLVGSPLVAFIHQVFKFNHRIVLFITFYCLVEFYAAGVILWSKYGDSRSYTGSAEDLVTCLLTYSDDNDPSYASRICGDRPSTRPYLWITLSIALQGSSNGVALFLVYGSGGRISTFVFNLIGQSVDKIARRLSSSSGLPLNGEEALKLRVKGVDSDVSKPGNPSSNQRSRGTTSTSNSAQVDSLFRQPSDLRVSVSILDPVHEAREAEDTPKIKEKAQEAKDSSHGHHPSRNGVGSLFSHKSQPSMSTTSSIGSQDPLLASTRTPVEQHEIFALATGTLIRESLSYEGEAANPMIFPEPASPSSPTPITEELIIDATQSPGRGDSMGIFFRRGSNDPLPRRKPSSAEMVVTQKAHTRTSST